MPLTPINGARFPAASAAPNVAQDMQNLASDYDTRAVSRFTTDSARDTAIPSPIDGMVTYSNNRLLMRRGGVWRKIGGATETLVGAGSFGNSGLIGPNTTTGVFITTFSAPVAAETCTVHFVAAMVTNAAGVTAATLNLTVNGQLFPQYFEANDQTHPVIVPVRMSVSVPAGSVPFRVDFVTQAGPAIAVAYSSLLITI